MSKKHRQKPFDKERAIAEAIIKAHIASETEKLHPVVSLRNTDSRNAEHYGYDIKEHYIASAISMILNSRSEMFNFYISERQDDQNGYPSIVIFFEFKLNSKKRQVSFHCPWNKAVENGFDHWQGKGRKTRWNGIIGGSLDACCDLAEYFNLPNWFANNKD